MELLISCGDEVEMGRRSPMVDGIYKITFLQRGILITQFFLKEKIKKEATGVLAMKETLFSDGRYEEPTVQYNTESAAFLRVSTLTNACILLIIY